MNLAHFRSPRKAPSSQSVLVTGGAGYIGSHVVRQLGEAGYEVVIYDNGSTGSLDAVLYGKLVQGDLAEVNRLYQVFSEHNFKAVLHFAASLIVPESVERPLKYYSNNTRNTLNLLQCCEVFGVEKLIFSSTAAVYGEPQQNPVTEEAPTQPINPYGRSKLMSEWMIRDYGAASSLKYVILRYFNVAGANPEVCVGQREKKVQHLISMACDAALGKRPHLAIFGTDYPTPDGTAIRDFIHIDDLASAHLSALRYLEQGHESQILNCGYGQGYSVQEVCTRVQKISGINFSVIKTHRRTGDPAQVVACVEKIHATLDWQPKHNCLDSLIQSNLIAQNIAFLR
jgi:UDP-glucose 4-epimerase